MTDETKEFLAIFTPGPHHMQDPTPEEETERELELERAERELCWSE